MNINEFSTERLRAARLQEAHFSVLDQMHQDPVIMATLGGVRSAEETRKFLDVNLAHWQKHGFGLWIFADKVTGQFVGRGGLRHVSVGGSHEIEMAYALSSEFWGRGLATEMAHALLGIASALSLTNLVCYTLTTNGASQRVMGKAGFQFEREIAHGGQPHVLYRMREDE